MTEGVKGTGKAVLEKLGYLGDSAGRRSDVPVTLNHELPNSVKALGILPANYGTSMLNVKPVQPSAIVVLPFTYYDQALYFNRAFPRINDPNTPLPHFNEEVISGCVTYLSIYQLALARASWSKLDLFDLDPLRPEKTQKKSGRFSVFGPDHIGVPRRTSYPEELEMIMNDFLQKTALNDQDLIL
ncbi:uncharacterized protein C8R40DRAFT_1069407 [Lentinula edodes]|uniref:uncharacterized protein n=1 Tax=Lentinula edodes TaxID=5353 RepID=UPI001E8CF6CD|nr:uncharacterized protein C8R40DRAFT_1069407 [Lentinula edodes]KAH7875387.1 hypothetical protein C8R40DRAFT_1069407 [Lentinula edodes]